MERLQMGRGHRARTVRYAVRARSEYHDVMLISTLMILIVTVRTQRDKTPAIELEVLASLSVNRSTPHMTLGRSKEVWVSGITR
jgi:hypothetical protein